MAHPYRLLLYVAVGGTIGTAARAALESAFPADIAGWPWVTFGINLTGAFILGAVLEALRLHGPDDGWRQRLRLGVGSGVLGGFTTYSTFILEIDERWRDGHASLAFAYLTSSVVAGVLLALAGMALVTRRAGRTA